MRFVEGEGTADLDACLKAGGYEAARHALTTLTPESVIDIVDQSGLRGKGGAGFPTGRKWKFIPKGAPVKYVVVNGDEAEPCTFKDHMLLERAPHLLVEGIIITAYAVRAILRGSVCGKRWPWPTNGGSWGGRSSARTWIWTWSCTPAPAPTLPAKRPRSSSRWKAGGRCRGNGRRFRRWRGSTASRR